MFEEVFHKNDCWANTLLDLCFARCQAITGEIGASVALWWRVRADVVSQFWRRRGIGGAAGDAAGPRQVCRDLDEPQGRAAKGAGLCCTGVVLVAAMGGGRERAGCRADAPA